jgi:hypothetical protein
LEKIEDSKGGIRRRRTYTTMEKRKRTKGQRMMYKAVHRKLTIEQHKSHLKPGVQISRISELLIIVI